MTSSSTPLDPFLPGKPIRFQIERSCTKDHKIKGCEAGMKSITQQEQEVRALQKALNLPQAPVLPASLFKPACMPSFNTSLLSSSTDQTRIVTETDLKTKTDSLYIHNTENPLQNSEQPYHNIHWTQDRAGAPLSASGLVHVPGGVNNTDPSFIEDHCYPSGKKLFFNSSRLNESCLWNPEKTSISDSYHGDTLYKTKTRECLTESCNDSRRMVLIDKVKEAQQVIEHQSETIAKAEHKISSLQKEVKKIELGKQIHEEEIKTLRQERENFDEIKSQGNKKRQALLQRLCQLDQDFKELNISHNALLVESKKKEADLLQTELRLNTLEDFISKLQQINEKLLSEQKLAKQQINKLLSDQKMLQIEKQEAKGETATAIQENKRLADENSTLKIRCTELHTQIWEQKTDHGKLIRELEELKMACESKCSKVVLLEEEVKQQQETFDLLYKEQEQSLQRNMEHLYLNKENFSSPGQVKQLKIKNPNSAIKVHDVESLKEELLHCHEEQTRLLEELESLHEEYTRILNENKNLKDLLDYSHTVQAELEKGFKDLSNSNEVLYSEVIDMKENEKKSQSITELQENLKQIKRKINSLEAEKCDLMSSLQDLQQDRDLWNNEKKEMMLSLAELSAENSEMRERHLKYTTNQINSEALSKEFQAIKQELDKVHKTLRLKDEELVTQSCELHDKQIQLNKLNEENTQLKKSFADIASKTSARNLVISTLRNQIEEYRVTTKELEEDLASKNKEFEELNAHHSKLEMELCQSSPQAMRWINSERNDLHAERDLLKIKVFELKFRLNEFVSKNLGAEGISCSDSTDTDTSLSVRRKSDGCLTRRIGSHPAVHQHLFSNKDDTLHALKHENSTLRARLDELVLERDSVLQDSEDLMEGMQQLKEAFENEIKTRLEKQRQSYEKEEVIFKEEKESFSQETQSVSKPLPEGLHQDHKPLNIKCLLEGPPKSVTSRLH